MIKVIIMVSVVVGTLGVCGFWKYSEDQKRNYWLQQQKAQHDYLLQQQMKKTNQYYGTVAGPQDPVEW
jgi:hypothetical protein